ncbi:tigger transposable element-derived protein 6 [Trichonephila clavipes]|nr:tigger transposable element-derived protein 6 [Trichonephila clavipes]
MDGSEKITPLVIGKSAKPRCFKGINSFPTKYRSKKKAWMTTELFNEWREVVKSVFDNLKNQQNVTTISILTALIMIDKAWRAVTPLTIHSCFKKSGFPSSNLVDVDDTLTDFNAEPSSSRTRFDVYDYVLVDTDIALWGALSDAEIVALDHNNTESDEDESEELTPITKYFNKRSLHRVPYYFLYNHISEKYLYDDIECNQATSLIISSSGNVHQDCESIIGIRLKIRYGATTVLSLVIKRTTNAVCVHAAISREAAQTVSAAPNVFTLTMCILVMLQTLQIS